MTNNVSGTSEFKLHGNLGKVKTTKTQSSKNGETTVKTAATKVSVFSSLDSDQSKHVSGEEMSDKKGVFVAGYKNEIEAKKNVAFKDLQGSAINIAKNKVNEMKDFGTKFDNMLTKFKSSKLFKKLSPENGKTSVSDAQIDETTKQLDRQANMEFSKRAVDVKAQLSQAMATALAEIAKEAEAEGKIQDIADAGAINNETKPQAEQPKEVKIDGKNNKNDTLKDGALTASKDNENVKKSKENQEVKDKDSKGSNNTTLQKLIGELGEAVELPIAGRPRGYKAQAWNNMINKHSELNGKQIKNMITEDNAKAALNRYLAAMEKN